LTVPVCVMLAVSLFLLIPVTLVLSTLLVWQLWLSFNDQTTIESEWEAAHASSSLSRHRSNPNSSSSHNDIETTSSSTSTDSSVGREGRLGRYTRNLSQIFGPMSYHWLMPTKPRLRLPSYLEETKGITTLHNNLVNHHPDNRTNRSRSGCLIRIAFDITKVSLLLYSCVINITIFIYQRNPKESGGSVE